MIPLREQMNSAGTMPNVTLDNLSVYEDKKKQAADRARARYHLRLQRLEREQQEQEGRLVQKTATAKAVNTYSAGEQIKSFVQAARRHTMVSKTQSNEESNKAGS
jgi:electron transport complex protein RnfB